MLNHKHSLALPQIHHPWPSRSQRRSHSGILISRAMRELSRLQLLLHQPASQVQRMLLQQSTSFHLMGLPITALNHPRRKVQAASRHRVGPICLIRICQCST